MLESCSSQDNISQAGCDFRFLEGTTPTPEPEFH